MYTIHNITDDFHGPKNVSNPSEHEDFPEFHPWPHLTSFAQLPHYCYLTAMATTTLIFHSQQKNWQVWAHLSVLVLPSWKPWCAWHRGPFPRPFPSPQGLSSHDGFHVFQYGNDLVLWEITIIFYCDFLNLESLPESLVSVGLENRHSQPWLFLSLTVANSVCFSLPIFFHTVSKLESPNFPISNP